MFDPSSSNGLKVPNSGGPPQRGTPSFWQDLVLFDIYTIAQSLNTVHLTV